MFSLWTVSGIVVVYLVILFAIAFWADRRKQQHQQHPYIYSFALGVHCTSWAFFGTTTQSAQYGWAFIPTYFGMIIAFIVGFELIRRIAQYCQTHQISSLADFIGARYQSQFSLSALVTLLCFLGVIPYIALQLDAITLALNLITDDTDNATSTIGIYVAGLMALFAILFGTRTLSLTEKHPGLMTTIAFESVIKLAAIMIVGLYICYQLYNGPFDLFAQAANHPIASRIIYADSGFTVYFSHTILGICAAFCLPRQFHINFVENNGDDEIKTARWLFPLYLILMSVFILPIALAGKLLLDPQQFSTDSFTLAIPVAMENAGVSITAFIGGISAATSMVIVATLALGIMISNNLVTPIWLRLAMVNRDNKPMPTAQILFIRRLTVIVVLAVAYWYHVNISQSAPLVQSGTIAMALLAQLTPAILLPFFWKKSHALAAWMGIVAGSVIWVSLLLWPSITASYYFNTPPTDVELAKGFMLSLAVNIVIHLLTSFVIRVRQTSQIGERDAQPSLAIQLQDLDALLQRILPGQDLAAVLPSQYSVGAIASGGTVLQCERLLASQVGIAGARVLLSTISQSKNASINELMDIAEQASQSMQFNHEVLQSSVQHIQQGISVLDRDLNMLAWNDRYLELFDYACGFIRVGMPIEAILRSNAQRGLFGHSDDIDSEIQKRVDYMREGRRYKYIRKQPDQRTIEINGSPLPGGGYVTTYADISEYIQIQEQLNDAKLQLEARVKERTAQLELAKTEADNANISKTKFLAAAGHDLMQPFNAAVLYAAMLSQRTATAPHKELQDISAGIQQSLVSAETLLNSLLDITKLESGVLQTNISTFSLNELFDSLNKEFAIIAQQKSVRLCFVATSLMVRSDKKLLHRILQNLLSNAIRYAKDSSAARVIVGCKRLRSGHLDLLIADNGIGIAKEQQRAIFNEFHQVDTKQSAQGLGLGLTIVDRMCKLLSHRITLQSNLDKGSVFRVSVPCSRNASPQIKDANKSQLDADASEFLSAASVLILENEPQIQQAVATVLKGWGATVHLADSLESVLQACPKTPDIVIVDYHLNDGETGVNVMQDAFKRWNKRVPGLLTTANRDDAVKDEALALGLEFLPKPVKPMALKRALRKALN